MDTPEDLLWMVKDGNDPWRVATKDEWIEFEYRCHASTTHGLAEPVTSEFAAHEGGDPAAPVLRGAQVKMADFGPESYKRDTTGLREAITLALKDRILEPANAAPHRRWTDAYDVGHGTAGP